MSSLPRNRLPRPLARGRRAAVACGHPLAAAAGLRIAQAGGNAVDAAIAAAAALFVVLPDACGIGGDALLTVRAPGNEPWAFNGSGAAPTAFSGTVAEDGGGTVAVPGAIAALEAASRRSGRLPWADLWVPAIQLAADGFPVTEWFVRALHEDWERLQRTAADWEPVRTDPRPGDVLRQPALADVLRSIAHEGAAAFYSGPVAEAMASAVQADGGWLSVADLEAHETVDRAPTECTFSGARIFAQPPVSQALLGQMALRSLDRFSTDDRLTRCHRAVEAIEAAFQHRDTIAVSDSEEELLDLDLEVDPHRAMNRGGPQAFNQTTAIATADADGTLVSMVVSVFHHYGSSTYVPSAGFFLNDRMSGFSRDPCSPNRPRAGARPVHTLSPFMVEADEHAFAIATPGADGQVQTLVQTLDMLLHEGASATEALDRPRWRSVNGRLSLELGFDKSVARGLAALGHQLEWLPAGDLAFGATAIAGWESRGGVYAAADLRREAWAVVW